MADQAQGLRALANRARRDHSEISVPLDSNSEFEREANHTEVLPNASTRYLDDVLNPINPVDARGRGATSTGKSSPLDSHAVTVQMAGLPSARIESHPEAAPARFARVIAITSGKGGVGKTNFCSNLALTLAARGQRVIVVDADLGLANVHVVMGVAPRLHLEHVMNGEKTLEEVVYKGPGGVGIIGGGSGLTDMANLDEDRRQRFIASLSELDRLADVVLLDTGAGLSRNVLAFLCAVDEIIIVTTPEPTAITDAYATIKVLARENPTAQQRLVVNMAQSPAEAQAVAERLQGIAQRFLNHNLNWLGSLPYDMTVSRAVRAQQPFTTLQPTAPVSRAILEIAARLGYQAPAPVEATSGVSGLLTRMQRFFGLRSAAV